MKVILLLLMFWNVVIFESKEEGRIVVEATLRELNGSVEAEEAGPMRMIFSLSVGAIDTYVNTCSGGRGWAGRCGGDVSGATKWAG